MVSLEYARQALATTIAAGLLLFATAVIAALLLRALVGVARGELMALSA